MERIIISLTTIDSRIHLVKKAIISILEQYIPPDIIHIWYSSDPLFYDKGINSDLINELYNELQIINVRNIKIIFKKTENIGSYRKLIPSLKIYNNSIIITIDDDHEHEQYFIEKFLKEYYTHRAIICSRARVIDMNNYTKYNSNINKTKFMDPNKNPMYNVLPEGVGGILYHTSMFDESFINFDYSSLPECVLKNDDIFFRLYTFRKEIPVMCINTNKSSCLNNEIVKHEQLVSLFGNYNMNMNISNIFIEVDKINCIPLASKILIDDIKDNVSYEKTNIINIIDMFKNGTELKSLQYEMYATDRCNNTINLEKILNTKLPVIVLNIEKDVKRYDSCVNELLKINTTTFIHLKATYWKEKYNLNYNLNNILNFLQTFNKKIINTDITFNLFSQANDPNILIQDGPLACYCTHVRALIYGYQNFDTHFIIVEDDILIANTNIIEKYITQVPEDWDIIFLNSNALTNDYGEYMYKFTDKFYSAHFYIINKKCLPIIFENIYPITDQIDILIAQLHDRLNIYNIVNTVYQKNFSTNTQNNLYVIYNSPNYHNVRVYISKMENELLEYINKKIKNNDNTHIRDSIIYDVIYNYINNCATYTFSGSDDVSLNYSDNNNKENVELYNTLYFIINCCVKGICLDTVIMNLIKDIDYIILCFGNHTDNFKALSYGSTSNVYIYDNLVYKIYNSKLRWKTINHDNLDNIFDNETSILKILFPETIINKDKKEIIMKYLGKSLYNEFLLPDNWKQQISNIFELLDSRGIFYPEFNIKNIVVKDNIISFVDYGIASISDIHNKENCEVFIKLLSLIQQKFKETDISQYKVVYATLLNNLKLEENYSKNIF